MAKECAEAVSVQRYLDVEHCGQGPTGVCVCVCFCYYWRVSRLVVRRSDLFADFIFEKSWSNCKHAFRPKEATMDAHMLSLSTWA